MSARARGRYSSDLRRGPVVKVLFCHPSGLMYTEIFLRLEPLGLELAARRRAARRAPGADPGPSGVHARRLLRAARGMAARRGGVRRQLPREHPGGDRSRQGDPSAHCLTPSSSWAATAPRSRRPRSSSTPPARSIASSRARARQACRRLLEAARDDRGGPARAAGRGHARRRGAARGVRGHRRRSAGARSAAAPEQVLHRRARSRGVHRADARVPLGLLVLQRLDVLRAQLPAPRARAIGEELARIREPGVFIVDDVAFIQAEHGFAIGARDRAARHPQALLPRDPRRRADAQPGGVRVLEAARPRVHVPRHRGDRRGGAEGFTASAPRLPATSRRWSTRARSASPSPSTSSPTPTGTSGGSR